MKLVSSLNGRASQQFLPDEIRAEHSTYLPEVVELAVRRYGFLKHSDVATAPEKGLKFENGRLDLGEGVKIAIETLDLFSDGVICVCRDTDNADHVLADFLRWATEVLRLRSPRTTFRRDFASWLVVDFEAPLLAKYVELQTLFNESFAAAYSASVTFDFQRLSFSHDPLKAPNFSNVAYSIERRGGAPFELNRFFCTAPLRTNDHLELLRKVEAALTT